MWTAYLQQLLTIAGLTLLGARYVRKNDLDGFLVWKQILIGKRCLTKGNFQSCSGQRMLSVPWSLLIDLRTGDIDNREVLSVWFSANWLHRYRKWAVMT